MENKNKKSNSQALVQESLAGFATKLKQSRALRHGDIILHLSGEGGGNYCLSCGTGQVVVQESSGMSFASSTENMPPLIEVSGDTQLIRDILDGKKDPVKQFLAGGLRVRGDLRYLSDLALEMNIIDQPL